MTESEIHPKSIPSNDHGEPVLTVLQFWNYITGTISHNFRLIRRFNVKYMTARIQCPTRVQLHMGEQIKKCVVCVYARPRGV